MYQSIDSMTEQLRRELKIPKSVFVSLNWVSNKNCIVSSGTDKGMHYDGLCLEPIENFFIININKRLNTYAYRFYDVLAHEFKHVKQMCSGQLWIPTEKTFYWNDKRLYFSDYPYVKRPHEIDADTFGRMWAFNNHPHYQKKSQIALAKGQ